MEHTENEKNHAGAPSALNVGLEDVAFPAPFSKEDTTGLCTVRDAVSYMREGKTDICEMCFLHQGLEWNVEIRILRSEESSNV